MSGSEAVELAKVFLTGVVVLAAAFAAFVVVAHLASWADEDWLQARVPPPLWLRWMFLGALIYIAGRAYRG